MVSTWTRLRAAADPFTRQYLGVYSAYPLTSEEYIGMATWDLNDVREWLESEGYEPQRLSAAKRHPGTGALHDISMRRVPDRHPAEASDTRLMDYGPRWLQYHVHGFVSGGREPRVEFFSHLELRPDLFRPTFSPERLREHYRPDYGETYLRGVTDLQL